MCAQMWRVKVEAVFVAPGGGVYPTLCGRAGGAMALKLTNNANLHENRILLVSAAKMEWLHSAL